MTTLAKNTKRRSGSTYVVVLMLTLLGSLAASTVTWCVGSRANQAYKQVCLEQAFYIAAAGSEVAASNIAAGNESSTTLTGTVGAGSYVAVVVCSTLANGSMDITITSTGTVGGVSHTVVLHGVQHVTWAKYALWYYSEPTTLWMVPGEYFKGPVASKPQLHFHNKDLSTKGQVHFYDKARTSYATIEKYNNDSAIKPIFDFGLVTSATIDSIATIDFSALLATATASGLVLQGPTTISASGSTLKITNSKKGWTNQSVSIPAGGLIYVQTYSTKSGTTTTTYNGDITLSATNGLTGRLTLVADNDINIANHVRYTANPSTDSTSKDALGLIAKQDVVVQSTAPNNLEIYAHIICQNGGFGVDGYSSGSSKGTLTVYGGIVNYTRNAVGTTTPTGYVKNYIYDGRFTKNPPPSYPEIDDELEWTSWEG